MRLLRRALLAVSASTLALATGFATAQAASAPGWRIVATIRSSSSPDVSLQGIAASGPRNAWAVGTTFSALTATSLVVERWASGRWRAVAPPAGFTNAPYGELQASIVAATSPANAWVFPFLHKGTTDAWFALRWNGTAWTTFKLGGAQVLFAASASGPADAWAFAQRPTQKPYTVHYNGHRWKQISMPGVPYEASTVASNDIWGIGPTTKTLGEIPPNQVIIAMHYDGRAWQALPLPKLTPVNGTAWYPDNLVALSARDVWVTELLDRSGGVVPGPPGITLLRWNGRHWSRVSENTTLSASYSPASDGHGGLWLTWQTYDPQQSYLVHYSGGRWTQQVAPGTSTVIAALASIPGTTSVWAAGSSGPGVILKYGS